MGGRRAVAHTSARTRRAASLAAALVAITSLAVRNGPPATAGSAGVPQPPAGVIQTVAGGGSSSGYGIPATSRLLGEVSDVTFNSAGDLFIADSSANVVYRVSHTDNVISRYAGTGTAGYSGDAGKAVDAKLNKPYGVAVDELGNLYIADTYNSRIRKVDKNGYISTFAGTGTQGYSGDGAAAASAQLSAPLNVAVDGQQHVLIADTSNHRIREVDSVGTITTVAGTGYNGYGGDSGPATSAYLNFPTDVAYVPGSRGFYIADASNGRVRYVSPSGTITTPAALHDLGPVNGVAVDADGNIYASLTHQVIWRLVQPPDTTGFAGSATPGFSGDGGPATTARLDAPRGMALDAFGNLFIADSTNHRVREVGRKTPTAPLAVHLIPGNGRVRVSWSPPAYAGGYIHHYEITISRAVYPFPVVVTTVSVEPPLLQADIDSLTNGSTYFASVRPFSGFGGGTAASGPGLVTVGVKAPTANGKFVAAGYVDFFSRLPGSEESGYWTAVLDNGGSRGGFVTALANSPEWVDHIVASFYYDTLGRPPDAAGAAFWVHQIVTRTKSVAQVAAQFYGSTEYYALYGHNDDTTWVKDLYTKILHRPADSGGLAHWVGVTQSAGRVAVAFDFYQSQESREDRVTLLYEELLGRDPDGGGLAYWAGVVGARGDVALAASLASSDEYYARAQLRF